MCWPRRGLTVFALLVFPAMGCGEETTLSTAPVVMTALSWDAEAEVRVPLGGAQLCQTDVINCAPTDSSGVATIQKTVGREISYTLHKEGYASYLFADILPPTGSEPVITMLTDQLLANQHERLMSPYPLEDKGEIAIELHPPFGGATFTLVRTTGKAYYVDEEQNWDADLTETTSEGRGGFLEVRPGTFQIELGGTAQGCVPGFGWPGNGKDTMMVPVEEGYRTFATVRCPVPR
jgi:hypothetical protein